MSPTASSCSTIPSAGRPPISRRMWTTPRRSVRASFTCVHPWIRRPAPGLTPAHAIALLSCQRNFFMLFLKTLGAVYSVTPRRDQVIRRRSINFIGQFTGRERMWRIPEIDSRTSLLRQLDQLARTVWPRQLGRGADSLGRINPQAPSVRSAFSDRTQRLRRIRPWRFPSDGKRSDGPPTL